MGLREEGPTWTRVWDPLEAVPPFIPAAVRETQFIPAPSNLGVLWGVRSLLQAGLGEESPSHTCNVEKSIPRDAKAP